MNEWMNEGSVIGDMRVMVRVSQSLCGYQRELTSDKLGNLGTGLDGEPTSVLERTSNRS